MRRQLRAVDTANSIRMARTHDRTRTFLIVEGDDDRALFAWHVDSTACRVEACYGRDKVVEVLAILDADHFPGVVGIADADYTVLNGERQQTGNLLLTDHHDVECLMLASPALAHVLHELGDASRIREFEKARGCSIVEQLHCVGKVIGHLRWASNQEKWALRFEGLEFTKFLDCQTLQLDVSAFVEAVRGQQGGRTTPMPTADMMSAAIRECASRNADPWHVCRGHDLVQILAIGFRRTLGTRNESEVRPERLEQMLRLAFRTEFFHATKLYLAMRAWEQSNPPFRLTTRAARGSTI